jgi:hypothetical protein
VDRLLVTYSKKWFSHNLLEDDSTKVIVSIVDNTREYNCFFSEILTQEEYSIFKEMMSDNKIAILNIKHPKLKEAAYVKMEYQDVIERL